MAYLGDDGKWYYDMTSETVLSPTQVEVGIEAVIGPFNTKDEADHDESAVC